MLVPKICTDPYNKYLPAVPGVNLPLDVSYFESESKTSVSKVIKVSVSLEILEVVADKNASKAGVLLRAAPPLFTVQATLNV